MSIPKGNHLKTCRASEVTSPARLAPLAASVKLDASCGFSQTPLKEPSLPPMTPTDRCHISGDTTNSLNISNLRRTQALSTRMQHEERVRVNTAFKMQLNKYDELSIKVRPPVSKNYLAEKLDRKFNE